MIIKDKICMAGSSDRGNEDIFGYSNRYNIAWVIDGATGLIDTPIVKSNYSSDAQWFSHSANEIILKLVESEPPNNKISHEQYIKNLLSQTIEILNEEFLKVRNRQPIDKYEEPCASISIILAQDNSDNICCASLGDCPILVRNKDNKVSSILGDEKHAELDKISFEHAIPYLKQGMSFLEMRKNIKDILLKHRNMMNSNEGYWIFSLKKESVEHIRCYNFDKQITKDVLVMSDGFYAIVDKYKKYSDKQLISEINMHDLKKVYDEIRNVENHEDSSCQKFPRLKQSDDATAIMIAI